MTGRNDAVNFLYRFKLVIAAVLVGALVTAQAADVFSISSNNVTNYNQWSSVCENASYVIFPAGSNYYAKTCDTGLIAYSGTNATTIINNAVSALSSTGGKIVLREGNYAITGTISISSDKIDFVGMGQGTILTNNRPTQIEVLHITGNDVYVGHLQINGNRQNTTPINTYNIGNAIRITANQRVTVDEVFGYGTTGNGVRIEASSITPLTGQTQYITVKNSIFANGNENGIYTIGTLNCQILNNKIYGYSNSSWDGIDLDPYSQRCLVQGNHVKDGDILIYDTNRANSFDNQVIGNFIEGSSTPCIDAVAQTGIQILDNYCYLPAWAGIILNNVVRYQVNDNFILGATQDGISFWNTASNNGLIEGNRIENVGVGYYGINTNARSGTISIIGNQILGTGTASINSTATTDIQMSANRLSIGSPSIVNTGSSNIISNNKGFNPVSPSTFTAGSSPYTYTNNDGYTEVLLIFAVNGQTALTCNGVNVVNPTTIGQACVLPPGAQMVSTWATSAPQFKKVPLMG